MGCTYHIMMCAMLLIFALQECIVHKLPASLVHCHHIFYQLTPSTMFRVTRYFPPLSHITYPNLLLFYSNIKLHLTFTPYPNPSYIHTIPHSHTLLDTTVHSPHTLPHHSHTTPDSHTTPSLPHTPYPIPHTHNPRLPHYSIPPPYTLPYPLTCTTPFTHNPRLPCYHTLPPTPSLTHPTPSHTHLTLPLTRTYHTSP